MNPADLALEAAHADPAYAWPQWNASTDDLAQAEREAEALRRALAESDRALAERQARRAARGGR